MNVAFESKSLSKPKLKSLLIAAVIGAGAIALAAPADARIGGMGGFHGSMGGFGGMGGFHGGMGGFHPFFMHPGSHVGFNPGFRPGFAGRPFFRNRAFFDHDRFHHNNGFAFGLVSGALLGGLAYGYPYDSYYDYGYPTYGVAYGGDCYVVPRRVVNPWGRIVLRREVVCD
ncbi:hypothetical protein [Microvirga sp. TS319]|uniref:hypothetical protein n=1 Tax=Microvirga sp. TS319 TaxID=3241165 RepID=UPI00351A2AA7